MTDELQTVIITGGAGGIGRALSQYFSGRAARVISVDRTLHEIDGCVCLQCDLADPHQIQELFKREELKGAVISSLINNAAVQRVRDFVSLTAEDFAESFSVNVIAAHQLLVAALPGMRRATNPMVVNMASVHARATSTQMAAYASSKAALISLTRSAAIEFAREGLRVLSVSPGAVDTPMLRAGLSRASEQSGDAAFDALKQRHPTDHISQPEALAQFVYSLCTNPSPNLTGADFLFDGAVTSMLSTEAYER